MKQHVKTGEDVISATKTVTPAFGSSATIDAATYEQEINIIKNKQNTLCLAISDQRRHLFSISLNNLLNANGRNYVVILEWTTSFGHQL